MYDPKLIEVMARAICVACGDDWLREGPEGLGEAYLPLAAETFAALCAARPDVAALLRVEDGEG